MAHWPPTVTVAVLHQCRFPATSIYFATNIQPVLWGRRLSSKRNCALPARYVTISAACFPCPLAEAFLPPPCFLRRTCRQGHVSISLGLGLHVLKLGLVSLVVLNYYWSSLMIICLKNFGGVTEIFTKAVLHTSYLSYAKSLSGSPSSTFTSFSLEKRTILSTISFLRSVSLQTLNGSVHPYL